MSRIRALVVGLLTFASVFSSWLVVSSVHAACGAVSCFIVIPSQQVVPQKGLLTINGIYSYTPMERQPGTTGIIPEIDQANRRLIPDHHRELSTITQAYTLDFNYGLTERWGLQLTLPYYARRHDHFHFHGGHDAELIGFSDKGMGDVRITLKYNVPLSLRSILVAGVGVEVPTGETQARDSEGGVMEAPMQLGRGNVGLVGILYQGYEVLPGRLSQFTFASYRHTFRNNAGYQFGDEYLLNAGFNIITAPWLVLTNQVNYRYMTHDNMSAAVVIRGVPVTPIQNHRVDNTGHTYLAYTPGVYVPLAENLTAYFFTQIPIFRDFNNNLAQGISYTFGITMYFTTPS